MPYQLLRAKDHSRLREAFAQRCDVSRLLDLNSWNIRKLGERHELLGEGGHFTAWRLKEALGDQQTSHGLLPLVYKRAHAGFDSAAGLTSRRWLEAIQLLKDPLDLVPPLLAGPTADGKVSLLMPYGAQPLAAAAEHWQPLEPRLLALRTALRGRGLDWPDIVQACCWDGVPFVFDWSELRLSAR